MSALRAIAAMSLNRVIGVENRIPWHIREDFLWFKGKTMGQVLLMGRKTFESIGRPLPGRETVVLSRSGFQHPGVRTIRGLSELNMDGDSRQVFVCGGADIYRQLLPQCADLWLTRVKQTVAGDAFFPEFEDQFEFKRTERDTPEFSIEYFVRKGARGFEPV